MVWLMFTTVLHHEDMDGKIVIITGNSWSSPDITLLTSLLCFYSPHSRTDPVRPFISGHVANSMASEVIALVHSLLTAPETHTAQIWASAVERVSGIVVLFCPNIHFFFCFHEKYWKDWRPKYFLICRFLMFLNTRLKSCVKIICLRMQILGVCC